MKVRCPHCHQPIELVADASLTDMECLSCGSHFNVVGDQPTASYHHKSRTIAHFQLLNQVGVGKFGSVWKARDTNLDRIVAIKIPRAEQLDEFEAEQFFREARAAAQVKQPNIVAVHEVGREGRSIYIVSDFIDGANLKEYLSGQPLNFRETAELCVTIANALHAAHESGVVHRDLKPQNIMMDSAGTPYIADFGLAKREAGEITMTVAGQILGTPAYMPPEQIDQAHQVDRRADVYSLGVILYELLTGELPFRGQRQMVLLQIQRDEAARPTKLNQSIPRDLETICLKCMEKDPGKRYSDAKELSRDLERYLAGKPIQARPISLMQRAWRWGQREPIKAALAGMLILFAVGGPLAAINQGRLRSQAETLAANNNRLVGQQKRANEELQVAIREKATEADKARHSLARSMAAQSAAIRNQTPIKSLLLAIESCNTWRDAESRHLPASEQSLRDALNSIGGTALFGHNNWISSLTISSDNRWLVTGSHDGTARIWDLADDDPMQSVQILEHGGVVSKVAISPNCRWLVTNSYSPSTYDSATRIWDLSEETPESTVRILAKKRKGGGSFAISTDNHWLAISGADGAIRVWDLTAARPDETARIVVANRDRAAPVAISEDCRWLLTKKNGSDPRMWDLSSGLPAPTAQVLPGHDQYMILAAFSPNGRWLVTKGKENTALLWDLTAEEPSKAVRKLSGHQGRVSALAISPDSRWVVTGSNDDSIRVWNLNSEDPTQNARVLIGHEGYVTSLSISPDSTRLVSGSMDKTVRRWNLNAEDPAISAKIMRGHETRVLHAAIGAKGRLLVTGGRDKTVRLWDMAAVEPSTSMHVIEGASANVEALAVSPDNKWMVTAGGEYGEVGEVRIWKLGDQSAIEPALNLTGHSDAVPSAAISNDNRWLVTGSRDKTARVWDLEAKDPAETVRVLSGHSDGLYRVAVSSNSRWLATGSSDDTARLWDLAADAPSASSVVLSGHEALVSALAFSPDNQLLVTCSFDGTARLWDLTAKAPAASAEVLKGHRDSIYAAAISPDNHWLVTAGGHANGRGEVRLWDLRDADVATSVRLLEGHKSYVSAVAISSDSRWLATGSLDNTARLWDLSAQDPSKAVHVLKHDGRVLAGGVHAVAFSDDNHWLVTGGRAPGVHLWDVTAKSPSRSRRTLFRQSRAAEVDTLAIRPDNRWAIVADRNRVWTCPLRIEDLLKQAKRTAGRNFTQSEWQEFFPGIPYRKTFEELPAGK